ncbi:MAG: O-antigen ligase family protein [Boseongicola sp.]|nr:O-antigen ligase family protein [Boseongicola sp.]
MSVSAPDRIGRFDGRALNVDACLGITALIALTAIPVAGAPVALVYLASGVALAAFRPALTAVELLEARLLLILPAFCLFSAIWSQFPTETLRSSIQLMATIVIAVLISQRVRPLTALTAIVAGLLPLVLASVLFGAYRSDTGALVGLFGSKNEMAGMSAILALIGVGLAVSATIRWPVRLLGAAGFLLGVTAILLAQSVGALIYLPFGLGAYLAVLIAARLPVSARLVAVLFGGLVSCLMAAAIAAHFALASAAFLDLTGKDLTLTGRIELWQVALNLIAERPLLGTGFQAFWVPDHAPAEALWTIFGIDSRSGFNFHNAYLSSAVEIGVIGTMVQVWLIGLALVRSGRLACRTGAAGHTLIFAMAAMLALVTVFEAPVFYQFNLQSVIVFLIIGYAAKGISVPARR